MSSEWRPVGGPIGVGNQTPPRPPNNSASPYTSYSTMFGTNGASPQASGGFSATQGGQPNVMMNSTAGPQPPRPAQTPNYQQTFAQMQAQGQARPAPPAPTAGQYGQYQGSGQAGAARAPMLQAVQQQLAQPTRFDTNAFQQIRNAQQGNLNAEFGAQRSQLEEDMARRGLSASSIGAGRYGDLAGQQARASATMDAELLQAAAQTQSQDRLASLQAAGQFADLAGSQDLAQFEANRVGQAQQFQEGLAAANFGQGQSEFDRAQAMQAANLEQTGGLSGLDLDLRRQLGMGGLSLDRDRLSQQGDQFGQSLGLDRDRMNMQNDQFGRDLGERAAGRTQQGSQFDREFGQRGDQFTRSLYEQEAARLQQGGQFDREFGQRGSQFTTEQELRRQLGMGDLDVRRSQAEADQRLAQNQFFMQMSQALSGLTAAQIQQMMRGGSFGSGGEEEIDNPRIPRGGQLIPPVVPPTVRPPIGGGVLPPPRYG